MTGFTEIGPGVHLLRYPVLDVNVTMVCGDGAALLVDTLSTDAQARELAAAARRVTTDPWTLVNTHHHFDHCFGNAVLAGAGRLGQGIWAHEQTAALLVEQAEQLPARYAAEWQAAAPALAAELSQARVLPPDQTVHRIASLSIGGREVVLRHLGRGHTAGDLVVHVPDADLVVAGDLVEQAGPPSFEDAYPLQWPETLTALLSLTGPATMVVPGHGTVVARGFVAGQQAELAQLAWLIRDGDAANAAPEAVAARSDLPAEVALTAVKRGYAELSGTADT